MRLACYRPVFCRILTSNLLIAAVELLMARCTSSGTAYLATASRPFSDVYPFATSSRARKSIAEIVVSFIWNASP